MRRQPAPESYVLRAVLDILAVERIFAIRLNTGTMRMPSGRMVNTHSGGAGTADILAFVRLTRVFHQGQSPWETIVASLHPLWIECKSDKGAQSDLQKRFQEHVESHGHHYLVARSSDDVLRWLKEYGCR